MATIGELMENRLLAVERIIADIQNASVRPDGVDASVDGPGFIRMQQQVALLKARIDSMADGGGRQFGFSRPPVPKELMPEVLGTGDYKGAWRTWAYKARDWIAAGDPAISRDWLADR